MTKYGEFIEAYKKAVPHIRKKLQYEQANKIWNDLKKKPDEFDQQFNEKMQEFKLMEAGNCLKNLKSFRQSRLNFGKAVPATAGKDREAFRTLVESLVQMTTFISRIFLKSVELQFKVSISAE